MAQEEWGDTGWAAEKKLSSRQRNSSNKGGEIVWPIDDKEVNGDPETEMIY